MSQENVEQPQGLLLTPEQVGAVNILIKGIQVGQSKGAYTLRDAEILQGALDTLSPPKPSDESLEAEDAA